MRPTLLNVVDNEGIHTSFHEVFGQVGEEILAEASLFNWIQGSLLSWIYWRGGSRASVLGKVGGLIC